MQEMIRLTIDNKVVDAKKGSTVLEVARQAGVSIPTLCYMEKINEIGACRVCVVEVEGYRGLQASCVLEAASGMIVRTNTPSVRQARRFNVELLLSNHPDTCLTCRRNTTCELQQLAHDLNVNKVTYVGEKGEWPLDLSNRSLVRDPNKCILCRRCVAVCHEVQDVGVISVNGRGFKSVITPEANRVLGDTTCVYCGQCVAVCPTAAITEVDNTEQVFRAIGQREHVVVQVAPAVRVAIGEEFGLPRGTVSTGQLVAGLRMLGFSAVFDTDFTADLTIVEEAHELLERIENGGTLPMITSCSPGWVKYVEHFHPEIMPNLSSCKSPMQMMGALIKSFYAEKVASLPPEKIVSVAIMPCTAKKFEASRPEFAHEGVPDVDHVLTTRELAGMFKVAGIELSSLASEEFDAPLGISTGAGVIFGASGGVMEAALRTAYEWITKTTLARLDFTAVRGLAGVKEATVDVPGFGEVRVAVASGLANASELITRLKENPGMYHFIEIMACRGGCLAGGGQPRLKYAEASIGKEARLQSIYSIDQDLPLRKSHENPAVMALYQNYLREIGGEAAHHLLHTAYVTRGRFPWRKT